ncbi:hypothetical protein [Metarhizobium album]|uniref:hypothetical protein n=1 Tax=Metarhizobium album TaxID=2182425 RepID=UPI0014037E47|nr:hypothetical protein [Rhizobium album]
MRDERPIIINPEPDRKGEASLATVFGAVFWVVMLVGLADHGLTLLWAMLTK